MECCGSGQSQISNLKFEILGAKATSRPSHSIRFAPHSVSEAFQVLTNQVRKRLAVQQTRCLSYRFSETARSFDFLRPPCFPAFQLHDQRGDASFFIFDEAVGKAAIFIQEKVGGAFR